AGDAPFSEPETRALSAFIQNLRPATVLFYHSAADGIFAGECNGDHGSAQMSEILGQATGYHYGAVFSAYPVTGTASSWVDSLGIPSADVELLTQTDPEFERNLAGVLALQRWLAG
ncbi:MAG: peptidase M14, partial [Anaerolineae bacterium]|nr:peptidase M14 [Anaerolineae bacterium]